MSYIVPKSKAKGVDICSRDKKHYIIRSDLGCYMESANFHKGENLEVYSLHPCCQDGDHYLADEKYFYIIKGDKYRRVTDLSTDSNAKVFDLHERSQGGDHYLWATDNFHIYFKNRLYITKHLNKGIQDKNFPSNELPMKGLYYWGTKTHVCFVEPKDQWGVHFQMTDSKANTETLSFHPDVLNFLPGGLVETNGPAFGKWKLIKTITNDSEIGTNWNKKITHSVGYAKSKTSSIEHNWKVSLTGKLTPELTKLIFNSELSISQEYIQKIVKTQSEIWKDDTNEEESVNLTLPPKSKIHVWQYQLGFGEECILFCRDIRFTSDPYPPSDDPVP